MKSTSPTGNDMIQFFSSTSYNGIPSRVSSNFQRNFGLGLGFNSPKNDPQKVITLSTKVTNDISRYTMNNTKPNGILERKSSRTTPEATPKNSPYMSSSLVVRADPSTASMSNMYKTAESRGSSADKRKHGDSSPGINSKQTPVYRPSSSRGGQENLRKELGYSVKSKKLEINTVSDSENIAGPIRSRSTKNQETSQNFLSGTIKKNSPPQYQFDGPYKLLTSATPPNKHAPAIAFSHKTQTEPNEERGLRGSSAKKSKGTIDRPFGGSAVYGSTTATRDSSKERESVNGQEKERQKITLNGNRKIGFSSNGQLKYTTLGQGKGVIKANNFFSSSASNWGQTISGSDKNKAMPGIEDLTKSANFEKKALIKTQDLRQSLRFSEKKETKTYKNYASEVSEENKQQKNQENGDEITKQVSLQSFVTKVNQGDMLSTMKKSIAEREVKSTRNSNKPVLAFDDKTISNGSNSVRDGAKSTKNRDLKVTTYNVNKSSQPNSAQDQPKQKTKSSKPSTPTLKHEAKESAHEVVSAQEKKPFIYFMTSMEKHHIEYDEGNYFCQIYREHFMQTFQAMMFCKYLKPVDSKALNLKKVHLPRKDIHKDKKTLIFDLDETLIHCNESTAIPSDIILPIRFPHGEIIEAGINIRPYANEILKELSQYYEIVVFTASHSCYANVVLDHLDPQGHYIQHRLFREHCMPTEEGVYVKDLRVIANRNMQDMIIVDNAAYSFGYQIENGIPIVPFYDNKSDLELKHLIPYLKFLSSAKDPREINKLTFKLHMYSQYPTPEQVLDNVILPN